MESLPPAVSSGNTPPENEPVFEAPWEAQVFALAVQLSQNGMFDWSEWTDVLASQIQNSSQGGQSDSGAFYYHHWTLSLEKILVDNGVLDTSAIERKIRQWREAYRNTPHGEPVTLDAENTPEKTALA